VEREIVKGMLTLVLTFAASWAVVYPVSAQEFPDGPGKEILTTKCAQCHSPNIVRTFAHTAEEWHDVVFTMNDQGADITDEEMPVLVAYLAKNWGRATQTPSESPSSNFATSIAPPASTKPREYSAVLSMFSKQGDFKDRVLMLDPGNDLRATVRRESQAAPSTTSQSGRPVSR
jgi:hypothetical protein